MKRKFIRATPLLFFVAVCTSFGDTAAAIPLQATLVVSENNGTTARVDAYLSSPDVGLFKYAFDVAFGGTLSVVEAQCFAPPGAGTDLCIFGPERYTPVGEAVLTAPPFAQGGEVFQVASFVVALNGVGGLVETGSFFPGTAILQPGSAPFTVEEIIGDYSFESVYLPEPSSGLLVALVLAGLSAARRMT